MSRVVSIRLREAQLERLARYARRLGRSPSETTALLLEEGLRMAEFGYIVFRDSPVGRQAYVLGTSVAVWEVVLVARAYAGDIARTAESLQWPLVRVQAALRYAEAYPNEIELALADNADYTYDVVARMLPSAEQFVVERLDAEQRAVSSAGC